MHKKFASRRNASHDKNRLRTSLASGMQCFFSRYPVVSLAEPRSTTGAATGKHSATTSQEYGTGASLLAASDMYNTTRLSQPRRERQKRHEQEKTPRRRRHRLTRGFLLFTITVFAFFRKQNLALFFNLILLLFAYWNNCFAFQPLKDGKTTH